MKYIKNIEKKCVICGNKHHYQKLLENNSFGMRDLDTRPPGMMRSLMHLMVEKCPICGYANYDITKKLDNFQEGEILSQNYQKILNDKNINFALNFQFQMKEIGIDVNVPIDEYHQRLTAASSNQEHLAIVITFGGRCNLSDILPRILTKTKTPIVLISSYDYTFKEVEADYQLYISPYENHYKKISSFSTRLSLLYILDVLYTCYFELDYQENIDKRLMYYHNIVEGSIK